MAADPTSAGAAAPGRAAAHPERVGGAGPSATAAKLVVWLDEIANHLPDGVTVPLLRRCQDTSPGSRVVATISSTDYLLWRAEQPELAGYLGEPILLRRPPSAAERAAAESAYPGRDFTHGIAAAFTGTAALRDRLIGGNTECPYEAPGGGCGLSRALVEVAIWWNSAGTTRPLTVSQAVSLAAERVTDPADDWQAHVDACLAWAGRRVPQGVSLLTITPADDGGTTIRAHPELADIVAAEATLDPGVWLAALDDARAGADSDAVGRIGFAAHTTSLGGIAQRAWDAVGELSEPAVDWLERADRYSADRHDPRSRIPPLERLRTLIERAYGPDHPEVARTLTSLGHAWSGLGEPGTARDLHQRALTVFERAYGPDHPQVARTLTNLGNAWRGLGEPGKARDMYLRGLRIQRHHYPNGHPGTRLLARNLRNGGSRSGRLGRRESHLGDADRTAGPEATVSAKSWEERATRNVVHVICRWRHRPTSEGDGPVGQHQHELVDSLVESGRYQNASEVLREGLRLPERQENEDAARLTALRTAVEEGWFEVAAGRFEDVLDDDLDDFLRELGPRASHAAPPGRR